MRGKVIHRRKPLGRAKLDDTIAIIRAAAISVEAAVCAHHIEIVRVGGQSLAAGPDRATIAAGGGIKGCDLLQGGGAIAHHPAMPTLNVSHRAKSQVHHPVKQKETWPIQVIEGSESGSTDLNRPAKFLGSRGYVERMQLETVRRGALAGLGLGDNVNGPARHI